MNRQISFIESKSPDHPIPLQKWVVSLLEKVNTPSQDQTSERWVVYSNDRRVDVWTKTIRPRSKILLVDRMAPAVNVEICFESKELVVVDKPAGLPTQKTLKDFEDNLYDQLRLFYLQKKNFPMGLPYVGLHHRLDRGTSGLVLMTKQRSANKEISELFKNRNIEKEYWACVKAEPETQVAKSWVQNDPIARGQAKKLKFFFEVNAKGDTAKTEFKLVESHPNNIYLLACYPKTGRTHQIRVHLSHKGLPILGDPIYGDKKSASRLMLHARRLKFNFQNQEIEIISSRSFTLK